MIAFAKTVHYAQMKYATILKILLSLIYSCELTAIANDDIIAHGKSPKWHSGTPTEELAKLCNLEKNQNQKILVCNAVISRYSSLASGTVPKEAKSQANYILQIYDANPNDAQYIFGLHDSHLTLGRIALAEGNLKIAKEELLKSLQVPETPPLQHIGPRMILARELLEKGEAKSVLSYLEQVEKIWKGEKAKSKLTKWRTEINAGKIPSFQ
ncbi:MAG TPA: hypothetical protein VIG33_18090 [Pseudobdellovibrionaceae bacterium]